MHFNLICRTARWHFKLQFKRDTRGWSATVCLCNTAYGPIVIDNCFSRVRINTCVCSKTMVMFIANLNKETHLLLPFFFLVFFLLFFVFVFCLPHLKFNSIGRRTEFVRTFMAYGLAELRAQLHDNLWSAAKAVSQPVSQPASQPV